MTVIPAHLPPISYHTSQSVFKCIVHGVFFLAFFGRDAVVEVDDGC